MTVHTTAVPIVKGLPVLGSATRLLRDTLRSICTLRAQGGVATIRVGAPTLFVVVDPRLVRQMSSTRRTRSTKAASSRNCACGGATACRPRKGRVTCASGA
jgi:hypothetical protein